MHKKLRRVHGLSHKTADGWVDCAALKHMDECKQCLFACHIDRGDWIIKKMCDKGKQLIDNEKTDSWII